MNGCTQGLRSRTQICTQATWPTAQVHTRPLLQCRDSDQSKRHPSERKLSLAHPAKAELQKCAHAEQRKSTKMHADIMSCVVLDILQSIYNHNSLRTYDPNYTYMSLSNTCTHTNKIAQLLIRWQKFKWSPGPSLRRSFEPRLSNSRCFRASGASSCALSLEINFSR